MVPCLQLQFLISRERKVHSCYRNEVTNVLSASTSIYLRHAIDMRYMKARGYIHGIVSFGWILGLEWMTKRRQMACAIYVRESAGEAWAPHLLRYNIYWRRRRGHT